MLSVIGHLLVVAFGVCIVLAAFAVMGWVAVFPVLIGTVYAAAKLLVGED